jgi:hypothetical protein
MKDLNAKTYNAVLTETHDYFKSQGISIIGEGFKEIATNPALLESYVESLVEGSNADSAAVMAQLMANANTQILQEGALAGIAPIASLSMPVIRKLWPKFALKDVLKTEVAKTPRFVISYMRPYMWKGDSERVYLPYDLKDSSGFAGDVLKKEQIVATVDATNGSVTNVDFNEETTDVTLNEEGLLTVEGASRTTKQPLDTDFRLASAVISVPVPGDDTAAFTGGAQDVDIRINERLTVNSTIVYDFTATSTFEADAGTDDYTASEDYDRTVSGQIIVRANLQKGTATVAIIGAAAEIVLTAAVTEEFNEQGWSVSFDIARKDVDIPSGRHLNAPLPIEALTDMMALYQIDGTKETVDLMTNTFAMQLDLEVLEFLNDSYLNQPGVKEFQTDQYPTAPAYTLKFDVRPAAGFAGAPKAWREELKPQIDHLSQKIKNNTYLQSGMFTLVGNPLDIQLLTNVDWQFRGGQGVSMDGVDVDYSVGTYVGANAYRVIASVNVKPGKIYLVFTPNSDSQMTYKYYPYTFNTEMGYIDPNRSRVPSIMMTKRHTFQEFLPAIGLIEIDNNDGTSQFSPGYAPWTNDTGVAGD